MTRQPSLALPARRALDRAGQQLLLIGSSVPLLLLIVGTWLAGPTQTLLLALAGACAAWSGGHIKYTLVTRAAFNQGFALFKLPVRGVREQP